MLHKEVKWTKEENNAWKSWIPKRGEIYLTTLDGIDSEQRNLRPFAILSNNVGNSLSTILVGCPISSRSKGLTRIHVPVGKEEGLKFESFLMCEHIRSVSKRRMFINNNYPIKVGELSEEKLSLVERAIMTELGFGSNNRLIL